MADIRDFMTHRQQPGQPAAPNGRDFGKQIRRHRMNVILRSVLIVAVAAALILLIYLQWKDQVYTTYHVAYSVPRTETSDAALVRNFNGRILTYSNDGMSCMDARGNVSWNMTFEMQNPMVSISGNMVAAGDYNGHTIYVNDQNGSLGAIDTNLPIRKFCISANGIVAAVLDDSSITWIYLYDTSGNRLAYFRTTMQKSGYPMEVCISQDGKLVGVSYLYVDSGLIRSSVAFYNFGEVGQSSIDYMVSSYQYTDAIVPVLHFMNSQASFAVSDNRLMFYSGSEKPANVADQLFSADIQSVYYGDSYVGVVFLNTDGETRYRIEVYNTDGELVQSQAFDMEYKEILLNRDNIIIYNDTNCCIYNIKGNEKFAGTFDKPILLLVPTSSAKRFLLVTSDAVETIELR